MQVGVTGATGFLGRYVVERLAAAGHRCRCWHRPASDRGGFEHLANSIEWVGGELGDAAACHALANGCQAVVHAALDYPAQTVRSGREFTLESARRNIAGTLQLIETARRAGVGRFVFISSCAVYDKILDDRPLDETHPLWPGHHYGAHKAAIEAFVHSFGIGESYSICALRPSGIYGVAHPIENSKWHELIGAIVRGEPVTCRRGGKEVHASDVARSVEVLLNANDVAGEAFNCCDRYISEYDVATLAKKVSNSKSEIRGEQTRPKHQIATDKLRRLGVKFGGDDLLEETIRAMVSRVQAAQSAAV
jgi:nucleoside-diphosphate-sugar epimerase